MKKILNFIMVLAVVLSAHGNNDEGKYTKTKNIKKAYAVNPDAKVDIKNTYGNISVVTWNEDKIDIDVAITVSGDSEKWVNDRINDIDVEFNGLKSIVSAKTVIGSNRGNSRNSNMQINYTVRIPEKGGVILDNRYGAITTGNIQGDVIIDLRYGRLTLGAISGNTVLDLQYCNQSAIESVKKAKVDANYSKVSISKYGNVVFDGNYSDVNLGNGGSLKYESNYTKFNLNHVDNFEGEGNYLTVNVGTLDGDFKLITNYSKVKVGLVKASAGDIEINSGYTNVDITHDSNYGYSLESEVSYGKFRHDDNADITKKDVSSLKLLKGTYKNGAKKVKIHARYGDVKFAS